jgi:hypothetical protein
VLASAGEIQWGDLATWIGSLATGFAFIATFWLLLLTRREQRDARTDQIEEQARKVTAWVERFTPAEPSEETVPDQVEVVVSNASDQTVYRLDVAVGRNWGYRDKDSDPNYELVPGLPYVISPGYRQTHAVAVNFVPESPDPGRPPVELSFGDGLHGRWWWRNRWGALTDVTERLQRAAVLPDYPFGRLWFMTYPLIIVVSRPRRWWWSLRRKLHLGH